MKLGVRSSTGDFERRLKEVLELERFSVFGSSVNGT